MSFNCYHRPSTALKSIYRPIVPHREGTAILLNLLRLHIIWKSLWSFHKHCNTVGRQCGPNLLNVSESTIRGPLHVSPVNWASSLQRSRHSFLRINFDVFIREAGLTRLSKVLQRKELKSKISETEPTTSVDQAHMKRPRDNRGG